MTRDDIVRSLTSIFHEVLDDPAIELSDHMAAKDIAAWDSLNHVNLVIAAEQEFRIRFSTSDIARIANVGEFVDAIARKLSST
jgi:acyl carrier protein